MKKLIVSAFLVILIAGCGNDTRQVASTTLNTAPPEAPPVVETVPPVDDPVVEPVVEQEPEADPVVEAQPEAQEPPDMEVVQAAVDDAMLQLYMNSLESAMKENLPGDPYVEYHDPIISVYTNFDGLIYDATLNSMIGNNEDWKLIRETTEATCMAWYNAAQKAGLKDKHVAFYILNDINEENAILTVLDGVTVYDAIGG